jgi:hypothetical protein
LIYANNSLAVFSSARSSGSAVSSLLHTKYASR